MASASPVTSTGIPHVSNWINGAFDSSSTSHSHMNIINPTTEVPIATIPSTSPAEISSIITSSLSNFHSGTWSSSDPTTRYTVLSRAASLLRSHLPTFIALEVSQTGRPVREMRAQLSRLPEWLEYFASLARTSECSVPPFKGQVLNVLSRQPLGVVVQITPWNHPLLIAVKKLAPALAAGNSVILKPSEMAPLSVLKLGELFKEAGLPDGTLQIVAGEGKVAGKALCEDPRIAKIDLTGGMGTYNAIAGVAAGNMVPVTAELGGKAPVCVFPSVDVRDAVRAALFAAFIAAGQTCVTGSRVLVHEEVYEEFVATFVRRTSALRIGDPTDQATQVGAVIDENALLRCEGFVKRAEQERGKVLCGGKRVDRKGYFFAPTIVAVAADSELANEEVFGPVVAVIKVRDEEEMLAVANGTKYALGASIWTNDFKQAHRVAARIEAGIVWVNAHHLNDPSSPWGGFGDSGIGKENGREAFESYSKIKSTVFNYGPVPDWFDDEVSEGARYG